MYTKNTLWVRKKKGYQKKLVQMFYLNQAQKGDEKKGIKNLFFICGSGDICI